MMNVPTLHQSKVGKADIFMTFVLDLGKELFPTIIIKNSHVE